MEALKPEPVESSFVSYLTQNSMGRYDKGVVRMPGGCIMPVHYVSHAERIRKFHVRSDDIWVCSFPKAGTTWTQEMVWLLMNNLDYELASQEYLTDRSIFLEFGSIQSEEDMQSGDPDFVDNIVRADKLASPRIIKTHITPELLPDEIWTVKPKIIYTWRDARDIAESYHNHNCLINGYSGTKEKFYEAFLGDVVVFSPFWDHIAKFWKLGKEPNVLINSFSDMKKDLKSTVIRTAKFLNCDVNDEELTRLVHHLSFEQMRGNAMVNHQEGINILRERKGMKNRTEPFMRSGKDGGYRESMSQEIKEKFNDWILSAYNRLGHENLPPPPLPELTALQNSKENITITCV